MKVISDIRLYKTSDIDNHSSLVNKTLNLAVRRVVMNLREQGFSLGEFDHLYLNFTTLKPEGEIKLNDSTDSYHPWYRYCDIGTNTDDYEGLENADLSGSVLEQIKYVLLGLFDARDVIENAFLEAEKGPQMLMRFKQKKSSKGAATVYLRLLDSGKYLPLLCVTDAAGNEILSADLPETVDLSIIGEIQLNSKKVTIKPRKNALAKELEPISFDIKL